MKTVKEMSFSEFVDKLNEHLDKVEEGKNCRKVRKPKNLNNNGENNDELQ